MPNLATVNQVYYVEDYDESTEKWRSVLISSEADSFPDIPVGAPIPIDSEERAYKLAQRFMETHPKKRYRVVRIIYETV